MTFLEDETEQNAKKRSRKSSSVMITLFLVTMKKHFIPRREVDFMKNQKRQFLVLGDDIDLTYTVELIPTVYSNSFHESILGLFIDENGRAQSFHGLSNALIVNYYSREKINLWVNAWSSHGSMNPT